MQVWRIYSVSFEIHCVPKNLENEKVFTFTWALVSLAWHSTALFSVTLASASTHRLELSALHLSLTNFDWEPIHFVLKPRILNSRGTAGVYYKGVRGVPVPTSILLKHMPRSVFFFFQTEIGVYLVKWRFFEGAKVAPTLSSCFIINQKHAIAVSSIFTSTPSFSTLYLVYVCSTLAHQS